MESTSPAPSQEPTNQIGFVGSIVGVPASNAAPIHPEQSGNTIGIIRPGAAVQLTPVLRRPVRVRTLAEIVASTEQPPAKVVDGLVEEGGTSC
jgi:hypothetical protein